jgi:hypothetical protein
MKARRLGERASSGNAGFEEVRHPLIGRVSAFYPAMGRGVPNKRSGENEAARLIIPKENPLTLRHLSRTAVFCRDMDEKAPAVPICRWKIIFFK